MSETHHSEQESNKALLRISDLEREIQTLRLDLEEKDRLLHSARHDFTVQSKLSESWKEQEVHTRIEKLFADLGGPLVQLVTQDYLYAAEGKTVQVKDVFSIFNRLCRSLKAHGLNFIGDTGKEVRFNACEHEPLNQDEQHLDGDLVTVRMVGLAYGDKILRRASVTRAGI